MHVALLCRSHPGNSVRPVCIWVVSSVRNSVRPVCIWVVGSVRIDVVEMEWWKGVGDTGKDIAEFA